MDLNLIVYESEFASEKLIYSKINHICKDGYKKIALSVIIAGENISNIPVPIKLNSFSSEIQVLNRLTVKVDEIMHLYQLTKNENMKYYDLLAIEPLNEKILNYINNGNFDCDLMTFSFADTKIVSSLKKANFSLPISKGIGIEINYANCLSSSSQRRQAIACGQMLVDKTNAKNIVLSSGSSFLVNNKSPIDVTYIGLLFGLNEFQSKKAVFRNGINVIKHAELRKNITSSAIVVDDNSRVILQNSNKRLYKEKDEESSKRPRI